MVGIGANVGGDHIGCGAADKKAGATAAALGRWHTQFLPTDASDFGSQFGDAVCIDGASFQHGGHWRGRSQMQRASQLMHYRRKSDAL